MGTGKLMKCINCGYEWKHLTGYGFTNVIYHCNKCGKQKSVKLDPTISMDANQSIKQSPCKCGGTFKTDSSVIICPKCHNHTDNEGVETILWD